LRGRERERERERERGDGDAEATIWVKVTTAMERPRRQLGESAKEARESRGARESQNRNI
jgi:hypothetical protein